MENVPEIQSWCPLITVPKLVERYCYDDDGKPIGKEKVWGSATYPDPERTGETFKGFIAILTDGIEKTHPAFLECCEFLKIDIDSEAADRLSRGLGYKVEFKELKACDFGAPTIRNRFYLVARNDGLPIVFPEPTHGRGGELKPYRMAAECIDFSLPCPSIFGRKKPLAVNTQRRIAKGLDKFVLKSNRPFIMPYIMCNNTGNACHSVEESLPTVTTGNRNFLCAPSLIQYHSETNKNETRGQRADEPIMTIDSSPRYGVNACYLSKYFSGENQAGADVQNPLPTVTGIDHNALVTVNLSCRYGNGADGRGKAIDEPMPTITAADHNEVIKTYLRKIDGALDLCQWENVRRLLNEYAGYKIGADEILIIEINSTQYFIADIGMRMLKPRELMLAQGFPSDYVLDIESRIGKKYSEAKQIARMGNAVCPPVATALIRANCADLAVSRVLETMALLNAEYAKTCLKTARRHL